MIIAEVKVNTRVELNVLFKKLDAKGYKWINGDNLLDYQLTAAFPRYIHIRDSKTITHFDRSIPERNWRDFT